MFIKLSMIIPVICCVNVNKVDINHDLHNASLFPNKKIKNRLPSRKTSKFFLVIGFSKSALMNEIIERLGY